MIWLETKCVSPVVLDCPAAEPKTESPVKEFSRVFPACVMTRSQAKEANRHFNKSEKVTESGIVLVTTSKMMF